MIKIRRNSNIEVLRLVLMVFILIWHIFVHGYGFLYYPEFFEGGGFLHKYETFALLALLAPATYCFMFISGYYGMRFTPKKFISILICLILTSVLTQGVREIDDFSAQRFLNSFFPISTNRWWFMTNYMLILVISPILNAGIERINKRQFAVMLLCLIAYNLFSILKLTPNNGSNFIGLITIFLIGRYCKFHFSGMKQYVALILFLICWTIQSCVMIITDHINPQLVFVTLSYNTPLITLMAISIFYFAIGFKCRYSESINRLLRPTLFVYLVTEGLSISLYQRLAHVFSLSVVMGCIYSIIIVVICLAFGHFIMLVSEKIARNIDGCFVVINR